MSLQTLGTPSSAALGLYSQVIARCANPVQEGFRTLWTLDFDSIFLEVYGFEIKTRV